MVDTLLKALSGSSWYVREGAAEALGKLQITDEAQYQQILIYLNRSLHDRDDDVRRAALASVRTLTDGRPLPGYRWGPLRIKQERRRRFYVVLYWAILLIGVVMVAFGLSYRCSEKDSC